MSALPVDNWRAIMTRQKRLTFFTAGYNQISNVFPFPVVSPVYFAGRMALGGMMQTALEKLVPRLAEEAHWNRMLSLGEQQRVAIARAILLAPDYLFLDEATASLDEATEARLYHLLEEKLPRTTLVSIGHRASLEAFHRRNMVLVPGDNHFRMQERAMAAAAG